MYIQRSLAGIPGRGGGVPLPSLPDTVIGYLMAEVTRNSSNTTVGGFEYPDVMVWPQSG